MTTELRQKVETSIERIQRFADIADTYCPDGKQGYYLAFSGGKDSVVVKRLMDMSEVKYDAHYRVTSVDPPELVRFIKEQHPDVEMDIPRYEPEYDETVGKPITMWNLIPKKLMPPTRIARYCCDYLKETGGKDRFGVTGVRWAESHSRRENQGIVTAHGNKKQLQTLADSEDFVETKKGGLKLINDNERSREQLEACPTLNKMILNPIIDWTDEEVWRFIREENIPYCKLYDEGFSRLGCIGCPMAYRRGREKEFARWPLYKSAYLRAFDTMLKEREARGLMNGTWRMGTTPIDVFNWWMEYDILPGQIDLLDDLLYVWPKDRQGEPILMNKKELMKEMNDELDGK